MSDTFALHNPSNQITESEISRSIALQSSTLLSGDVSIDSEMTNEPDLSVAKYSSVSRS